MSAPHDQPMAPEDVPHVDNLLARRFGLAPPSPPQRAAPPSDRPAYPNVHGGASRGTTAHDEDQEFDAVFRRVFRGR